MSDIPENWFDAIDKHFPKGKCKERGAAIVLAADLLREGDGYHTFKELYRYRSLLHAAWLNMLYDEWVYGATEDAKKAWDLHKSWRHADKELCFGGGWFIVVVNLPTGQFTNHYPKEDWDLFHIDSRRYASKWDGHTPEEAADRLEKYIKGDWN